jgi:hypothetical protein
VGAARRDEAAAMLIKFFQLQIKIQIWETNSSERYGQKGLLLLASSTASIRAK